MEGAIHAMQTQGSSKAETLRRHNQQLQTGAFESVLHTSTIKYLRQKGNKYDSILNKTLE